MAVKELLQTLQKDYRTAIRKEVFTFIVRNNSLFPGAVLADLATTASAYTYMSGPSPVKARAPLASPEPSGARSPLGWVGVWACDNSLSLLLVGSVFS